MSRGRCDLPDLADGGREGHAHRLEDFAASAFGLGSQEEVFSLMVHFDFFQCLEIRDDVDPFEWVDRTRQAFLQCLAQHQGEEGAEHMAADGVIALVEDGPRLKQRFRRAEDLFHHPKLLVLQRDLGGREIGIGA